MRHSALVSPTGQLLLSMAVFGTIGLVRRNIAMPSVPLALLRAVLGCLSLVVLIGVLHRPVHLAMLRKRLSRLLVCGLLMGLDWTCFFEAFNHTTVAIATLCYYMAPVFMLVAAPFVFHEHLGRWKIGCAVITVFGMLLVSGVLGGDAQHVDLLGLLFALLGAVFYAGIIIVAKTIQGLDPFEETAVQLGVAALILCGYCLGTGNLDVSGMNTMGWALLLLLGVFHTGIAYAVYFGALQKVPAQTTALLSYVDPIVAVLLSIFVLQEPVSLLQCVGIILVLGGMIASERK